jgi:hypothetical protein
MPLPLSAESMDNYHPFLPARPLCVRLLCYAWALPGSTILGLALALLTWLCSPLAGGTVSLDRTRGLLEVIGGVGGWFTDRLMSAAGLTLGHVLLAPSEADMADVRTHEWGHVLQCERWGPLFLPAYFGASALALCQGRHYYKRNWFELDAERFRKRLERALNTRAVAVAAEAEVDAAGAVVDGLDARAERRRRRAARRG